MLDKPIIVSFHQSCLGALLLSAAIIITPKNLSKFFFCAIPRRICTRNSGHIDNSSKLFLKLISLNLLFTKTIFDPFCKLAQPPLELMSVTLIASLPNFIFVAVFLSYEFNFRSSGNLIFI